MNTAIFLRKTVILAFCAILSMAATGCATAGAKSTYNSADVSDPIEPVNRGIFAFNDMLDRFIIEPVAKGYHAALPGFVRNSVQSFMRNLNAPVIVANNLLQGNFSGAGVATARFVINTTVGVAGLVDVASTHGLEYRSEDFGQTLATWGVGDGFYLVLPVFGPSTLRDTAGLGVDTLADPVRIWSNDIDHEWIYITRVAIEGVDTRSRMLGAVSDLRNNSLDYYASVRSAYAQKRHDRIRNRYNAGPVPNKSAAIEIPDYDTETN